MKVNGDLCHDLLINDMKPILSFDENKDFFAQRETLKNKFIELSGIDLIAQNACPLNIDVEYEEKKDGYTITRFTFESEKGAVVPCYLLVPDTGKKKYPVVITLQGHSTGFHNSIGVAKYKGDEEDLPRVAFALQAVENGYAALAIEQRGMGENKPQKEKRLWGKMCSFTAQAAFLIGRTLIGERVWDVSKAIDVLANFSQCDTDNIMITGSSGGGTASYYSACYDERIKICAPSCAFCPYKESILDIYHCACNFIPSAYKYFDMQDLACLIAPRKLVIITGKEDIIFPIEGVERGYETVKKIYEKSGYPENCKLLITPKGHYWCPETAWKNINEAFNGK
nr:acetylxylan esterase [Clostridia bacterium]